MIMWELCFSLRNYGDEIKKDRVATAYFEFNTLMHHFNSFFLTAFGCFISN